MCDRCKMKIKLFISTLLLILFCISCSQLDDKALPITITQSPFPTNIEQIVTVTPISPTDTPTAELFQKTPYSFTYDTDAELISIIDGLFPGNCIKDQENLVTTDRKYIEAAMQVGSLEFTEISELPQVKVNYFNEYAENYDNSRIALAVCVEGDCSKLYVRDNESGSVFAIDFGADPYRPLELLHWINKDTVVVGQIHHRFVQIYAINIEKEEFEYYGMISGCRPTPMPVQIVTDTIN